MENRTGQGFDFNPNLRSEILRPISIQEVLVLGEGDQSVCGGVNMAIEGTDMIARMLRGKDGNLRLPFYTTNPIVHNHEVQEYFKSIGQKVEPDIDNIPDFAVVSLSAHGATPEDRERLEAKSCSVIDFTCQLVGRVQNIAKKAALSGDKVIYVGSKRKDGSLHPETRSILGHVSKVAGADMIDLVTDISQVGQLSLRPDQHAVFLQQTTFSLRETDEIAQATQDRFGEQVKIERGICHATTNRQKALEEVCPQVDATIVIGSGDISHNTMELIKLARSFGPVFPINNEQELNEADFHLQSGIRKVLQTSGASVPMNAAPFRVLDWFQNRGSKIVRLDSMSNERTAAFKKPESDIYNLALRIHREFGDPLPEAA